MAEQQQEGSSRRFIRVWRDFQIDQVQKQLLLVDDLYGSCGSCKQLGLNYLTDRSCPSCGAIFRYLATRLKGPGESARILQRIRKEGLNLELIDRDDYEQAIAKDRLSGLFSNPSQS